MKFIVNEESWIHSMDGYEFPIPIVYHDIEIYGVKEGNISLIATANELVFKSAFKGMEDKPPHRRSYDVPLITNFAGYLSGIEWKTGIGPQPRYHVGTDFFMPRVLLKWRDGEALFDLHTYLSFRQNDSQFSAGYFGSKVYSIRGSLL